MTEHKFTDEEVIKALEHCINDATCEQCNYSPSSCFINENALDLIKRQRAEISYWMDEAANAKKEAIKEFAERLKERAYTSSDWSHGEHPQVVECDDINDIVEELTEKGEPNGQKEN